MLAQGPEERPSVKAYVTSWTALASMRVPEMRQPGVHSAVMPVCATIVKDYGPYQCTWSTMGSIGRRLLGVEVTTAGGVHVVKMGRMR